MTAAHCCRVTTNIKFTNIKTIFPRSWIHSASYGFGPGVRCGWHVVIILIPLA